MLKKVLVLFSVLPLTAMAAPVVEGTYVSGTNKRVHLSSFNYEGSKHYELFLANLIGDSSFVIASKAKPIQDKLRYSPMSRPNYHKIKIELG